MSIELLHCPFCGGRARYHEVFGFPGEWSVVCENCLTAAPFHRKGKEKACAEWNRRSGRPCIAYDVIRETAIRVLMVQRSFPEGLAVGVVEEIMNQLERQPAQEGAQAPKEGGDNA